MTTVSNYTALRGYAYTAGNESVFVQGYTATGDGGEGVFYWDPASTTTDNNGTIIKVTAVATGRWRRLYDGYVNIQWFGARPGSSTYASGNVAAIVQAVNNFTQVLIPQGEFFINNVLGFLTKNNRTIFADGATIRNTDVTKGTLYFEDCEDINIQGGIWTRTTPYTQNDAYPATHTFRFGNCAGVTVDRVHIDRSPQMGINFINVVDVVVSNSWIQNCWRDGIYSHYCANVTYIGNHLQNIKDDAMSIHDYGDPAGRSRLIAAGYETSGHSVVIGNTVAFAYTGFASIGCEDIVISNNQIEKTVTAGVAVFNDYQEAQNARVKKISINNNIFNDNCGTQTIMGVARSNSASSQASRGRATIFVGSLVHGPLGHYDIPDPYNPGDAAKLSNIIIVGNQVTNGHVNGAYVSQVDGLVFSDNTFTDCLIDGRNATSGINTGNIIELFNSTDASIYANKVIDDRTPIKHYIGYAIISVTGNMGGWTVRGTTALPRYIDTSKPFPYDSTQRFIEYAIVIDPINLAIGAFDIVYSSIAGPAPVGDFVTVAPPYDTIGVQYQAYISNLNQIALLLKNARTDMAVNLASGTWKFRVFAALA